MLNVAVLYGGPSAEHEVSLTSAVTILRHIDVARYSVVGIGVDTEGRWYVDRVAVHSIQQNPTIKKIDVLHDDDFRVDLRFGDGLYVGTSKLQLDVALCVIHGTYGEDGTVQALLSSANIPLVGCNVLTSALSMHKGYTKMCWLQHSLPVAPFASINIQSGEIGQLQANALPPTIQQFVNTHRFPLFVKPSQGGSSLGITKAETHDQVVEGMRLAFQYDTSIIIEQGIEGIEIEFALYQHPTEEIRISDAGQIISPTQFYDYQQKYDAASTAQLIIPAPLEPSVLHQAQQIAKDAYRAVGATDMARIDMFVDTNNAIFLNEINTVPGFTDISMYPLLWNHHGIDCTKLIDMLFSAALERTTVPNAAPQKVSQQQAPPPKTAPNAELHGATPQTIVSQTAVPSQKSTLRATTLPNGTPQQNSTPHQSPSKKLLNTTTSHNTSGIS